MILSRAAACAFRGMSYLATLPEGTLAKADEIAAATGLPSPFVSKELQRCVRRGWVRSVKGPAGGFGLKVPPGEIRLFDVVEFLDGGGDLERCPLCAGRLPCEGHVSWMRVRRRIVEWLQATPVAAAGEKRQRPARRKRAASKIPRR
jgi:Rrf2 family protein